MDIRPLRKPATACQLLQHLPSVHATRLGARPGQACHARPARSHGAEPAPRRPGTRRLACAQHKTRLGYVWGRARSGAAPAGRGLACAQHRVGLGYVWGRAPSAAAASAASRRSCRRATRPAAAPTAAVCSAMVRRCWLSRLPASAAAALACGVGAGVWRRAPQQGPAASGPAARLTGCRKAIALRQ